MIPLRVNVQRRRVRLPGRSVPPNAPGRHARDARGRWGVGCGRGAGRSPLSFGMRAEGQAMNISDTASPTATVTQARGHDHEGFVAL